MKDLEQRRQVNPRYSLRGYARHLNVSAATLSLILRGNQKWQLSKDRAAEILERTSAPTCEKARILSLMGKVPSRERKSLDVSERELLTDWVYLAVLAAHDLPPLLRTPEKIGEKMGIGTERVREVIDQLLRKGLLRLSQEGVYERNPEHLQAGDGPPSDVVREHHKSNLKLSCRAVDEIPAEQRDFTSMTFVGSSKDMELLRKEIRDFHERLISLMNRSQDNTEVYRLTIGLFPIRFEKEGDV